MGRIETCAEARRTRIGGHNPWLIAVRGVDRFNEVRVLGLGAEMAYYALVSVVPLVATFAAALGTLERFLGSEQARQLEDQLIGALAGVFSPEMTANVMEPLVRGLLAETGRDEAALAAFRSVVEFGPEGIA